jgi:hypothetical protein
VLLALGTALETAAGRLLTGGDKERDGYSGTGTGDFFFAGSTRLWIFLAGGSSGGSSSMRLSVYTVDEEPFSRVEHFRGLHIPKPRPLFERFDGKLSNPERFSDAPVRLLAYPLRAGDFIGLCF